jgi:ring-1,2-phenylacetyl-CoA epoxidase subunit PaaE
LAEFFPLRVAGIAHDTRDAVVVTLEARETDAERFHFRPGQYLTLRHLIEGTELRRSYSICSAPGEALRVGVKRVDGGAFSSFAKGELKIGDTIEAMAPQGRFVAPQEGQGRHYLGFAAGSGITPVLSIAKAALSSDADARFTLVYGNRAVSQIMFRRELGEMKDRWLSRFSLVHILSGEGGEIPLFSGRIDADKCRELFRSWVQIETVDAAFICGPEAMMREVSGALEQAGLARDRIRFELFGAAQPGRLAQRPASAQRAEEKSVRATILMDGTPHSFAMGRDETILDAARAHDLDAPFSCHAGVCSTCVGRLVSGEVEMAQNYALEDYEVKRGLVLTCQARPLTDTVTIEYGGH